MSEGPVVFIYDHFYPDFSAGGPVTSLVNLANALSVRIPIQVITSSRVFATGKRMEGITTNQWSLWMNIPIWYASDSGSVQRALKSLPQRSTIYLNGVFSVRYFLYPLLRFKGQVIIAPRGMLQKGAMERGYWKKRIFLSLLKLSGRLKKVRWHATDEEEKQAIVKLRGSEAHVTVIPNIPRAAATEAVTITKKTGKLKLIYFSLIAAKKNLLFLIELLDSPEFKDIALDIAGPVKDEEYWSECGRRIQSVENPQRIKYVGEIEPRNISAILSDHHFLALPSLGENYGHAIIESLGTFRPVIISDQTPWKDIEASGAGFSLPLEKEAWREALGGVLSWDQSKFDDATKAAVEYHRRKINYDELQSAYIDLFKRDVK